MENEFFVKDYVKASVLKENLKKMEVLLGEQGRSIVRSVLGVKGTCIVYGADVCTHRSLVMSYLAEYFKAYDICCYHTVFGNFVADYAVVESHVFRDLCRNTDVFLIDDVGRYELSLYRERYV